ncbi:hypothetical protein FM038_023075 [Shewanella eurypsychrophilus]|uniref:SIR2-like domain-containing protein n=1 Tax=Shewanella eurypsychrophilus TaxID=2593656 RepID=A0ABX6VDF0_9GAMM|nr:MULTISPECIES: hypothetical protein [Shewanella]QFU24730.1 hypothetical protein FS418_24735 [Shewanella sp. YLB-09]QPG59921.1 hypothetical protein FM038_023075 [Shewanella eurypsychrophilus]
MKLVDILDDGRLKPALVIGNGINRYNSTRADGNNSWDKMLLKLWEIHSKSASQLSAPEGISLTEFYDALDLTKSSDEINLQKEFCGLMSNWTPKEHHVGISTWAQSKNVPILTTNFEETLSSSFTKDITHFNSKSFTDFYPWESYFSNHQVRDPAGEFAIWHINGMQRYNRSIRLGLSHYMGSVERARRLIHKGNESRLFSGKNVDEWSGYQSWLHVVFNNDLIFIGLGLDTTEVFLRWLLIERAKYFNLFPHRRKAAYFVHANTSVLSTGQTLFLSSVGVQVVHESSYDELYRTPWALS